MAEAQTDKLHATSGVVGQGDSESEADVAEHIKTEDNPSDLFDKTEEKELNEDNGIKQKRPPRSERKRRRHEELLLKRKEDRKRKKAERKMRLKEQRNDDDTVGGLNSRELKEERRNRCREAMNNGQKICIDCSLEEFMSEKEKGKLAMQIGRLYGSNLRADNPAHIFLTGLNKAGALYQECLKKMDGFENYLIDTKEETHSELFPLHQVICLSPDSDNLLTDVDPDKVYVIGGLVDESIKQCITENRAAETGIKTARLPIAENMVKIDQSSHSQVLAVNQVFDILLSYISTKDWKKALSAGVPRRKGYITMQDDAT